jgi:hypothetical protein
MLDVEAGAEGDARTVATAGGSRSMIGLYV